MGIEHKRAKAMALGTTGAILFALGLYGLANQGQAWMVLGLLATIAGAGLIGYSVGVETTARRDKAVAYHQGYSAGYQEANQEAAIVSDRLNAERRELLVSIADLQAKANR